MKSRACIALLGAVAGCGGSGEAGDTSAAAGAGGSGAAGAATSGQGGAGGVSGKNSTGGASAGQSGKAGSPPGGSAGEGSGGSANKAGAAGASAGAGGKGGAVSKVCEDGVRDPVKEECDDGTADAADACTVDCRVRDLLLVPDAKGSPPPGRKVGVGGSKLAVGSSLVVTAFADGPTESGALVFRGVLGEPAGDPAPIAPGARNAGVATVEGDTFAVVTVEPAGLSLRLLNGPQKKLGAPVGVVEGQGHGVFPEIVSTSTGPVVAYVDDSGPPVVMVREFDKKLVPLGPAAVASNASCVQGSPTLARFGGSYAVAHTCIGDTGTTVEVAAAGVSWSVGPITEGDAAHGHALVELDSTHLLLVASTGVDQEATLRFAVLDVKKPGLVEPTALPGTKAPSFDASAAKVGDKVFLAYSTDEPSGTDAWLREIQYFPVDASVGLSSPAIPLPREPAHLEGDQRSPRLATTPAGLVALWTDVGGAVAPTQSTFDIVAEYIPVPILRIAGGG